MTVSLTQKQAIFASNAYYLVDMSRRMTRNHAHPTGAEVPDVFSGTATETVPFGGNIQDSVAKVTFDPENPIRTSYDASSMENGYDPTNAGSATTRIDLSNTVSLATALSPHTHITYKVSPQGETMAAWTGLGGTKVSIKDGQWTIKPIGLQPGETLVLPDFDNRWTRSKMYLGTTAVVPGPMIGQG